MPARAALPPREPLRHEQRDRWPLRPSRGGALHRRRGRPARGGGARQRQRGETDAEGVVSAEDPAGVQRQALALAALAGLALEVREADFPARAHARLGDGAIGPAVACVALAGPLHADALVVAVPWAGRVLAIRAGGALGALGRGAVRAGEQILASARAQEAEAIAGAIVGAFRDLHVEGLLPAIRQRPTMLADALGRGVRGVERTQTVGRAVAHALGLPARRALPAVLADADVVLANAVAPAIHGADLDRADVVPRHIWGLAPTGCA
mmetsp:Transcript_45432/g.145802  ORF Transcript_45432/g.145802 Transcript_45432/m.145802 type:complete len:268 (+) Transcript_45432:114-917(+)